MRALELLNYLGGLDDNGNLTEVSPICGLGRFSPVIYEVIRHALCSLPSICWPWYLRSCAIFHGGNWAYLLLAAQCHFDNSSFHHNVRGRGFYTLLSGQACLALAIQRLDVSLTLLKTLSCSLPSPAQVGTIMAEYPLDPQLAKMVVASPEFRWLLAAGISRLFLLCMRALELSWAGC